MGKNTDRKIIPANIAWKSAGNATLLYSMSEEAQKGKEAGVEKRKPNFKKFSRVS